MKNEKKTNIKAKNSWEILKKLMDEKGVTAYKIAKDNKGILSPVMFTDWKNGRSIPKFDKVKVIANYLGVTTDYIMGFEEDKKEIENSLPNLSSKFDLTADEQEILTCYKRLSENQKNKVRSLLFSLILEKLS